MLVGMGRLAPASLYPVVPGAHWVADWTPQPRSLPLTHNPSGRTMALGLTQPLTEMCTRNISWGVYICVFLCISVLFILCCLFCVHSYCSLFLLLCIVLVTLIIVIVHLLP
jgi:hypothetical protein